MQGFKKTNHGESGAAMISVLTVVTSMAMLSLTVFTRVEATSRGERQARELQAARYVADAGISTAFAMLREGADVELGSADQPIEFGGGTYWVTAEDLGGLSTRIISEGEALGKKVRSELVVREVANATPQYGIFGDELLVLSSNAFADSYNSATGPYDSQATNTNGNDTWAKENGNLGSNADINVEQNAGVHGNATPGVTSGVVVGVNAEVSGSTLPAVVPFNMPELAVPAGVSTGDMTVQGSATLGPGTYFLDDLKIKANSRLDVTGPVTFVIESLTLNSNAEFVIDATAGGAEFFVMGDFVLESNTLFAASSLNPADLHVNLKGNNVIDPGIDVEIDPDLAVGFKSNSKMYGTLFAPKAFIDIRSNFELFGSLMARRLHVSSNSMVHYDEHLSESDEDVEKTFEVVGWLETPELN